MFEFLRSAIQFIAPVFVISTMLNVGLTQKPSDISRHLKNWSFVLKMLLANFVFAPLLMILALHFAPFDPALKAGLLIFSLGAGAPLLIKLTQTAQHEVALGAAVMMLLTVVTVAYMPIVLPLVVSGVSVDAMAVGKSLLLQLLVPIGIGMLLVQFLPGAMNRLQPWVARIGNIALYALIVVTLVGYYPNLLEIVGQGAFLVGLAFVGAAFGLGYLAGWGKDHLEDIGGLGTAQRNTAAGVIIALQNFSNPNVLVMLTLANMLGIVMLLLIAKALSRDNRITVGNVSNAN
ncbi:MAG TPA: bile acid:sodium symporter [Pyrinomonadaceae bacterium]|nr:bile acid:sodium symporter [Pyrinomonadaceae bacterium]